MALIDETSERRRLRVKREFAWLRIEMTGALAGVAICGTLLKVFGIPDREYFDLGAAIAGFCVVAAHRINIGEQWSHLFRSLTNSLSRWES